jgi:hypothetical protein
MEFLVRYTDHGKGHFEPFPIAQSHVLEIIGYLQQIVSGSIQLVELEAGRIAIFVDAIRTNVVFIKLRDNGVNERSRLLRKLKEVL